jgi:processive 1,2-diacylglycerol beta-glucosyltransferase
VNASRRRWRAHAGREASSPAQPGAGGPRRARSRALRRGSGPLPSRAATLGQPASRRVLVVSASLGAGHDGAAAELARRLEALGVAVEVRDFVTASFWAGPLIRSVFEWQLRSAPWAYELTFDLWNRVRPLVPPVRWLLDRAFGRRLEAWVAAMDATLVVSTYPLATVVLGRRRRKGRLGIPVVSFLTDIGVHPLCVDRGVDLHLCVHLSSARQVATLVGGRAGWTGPMVRPEFADRSLGKDDARRRFGIAEDARAALVVAGSWGVGEVDAAVDDLAQAGWLPVVVCGRNEALATRLRRRNDAVAIGWCDDMPSCMRATDVLVQNAGGLTAMEAFAAGLPVVTYRPIPGHGRLNAKLLDEAGIARWVRDPTGLGDALEHLVGGAGALQAHRARRLFAQDPGEIVAVAADSRSQEDAIQAAWDLIEPARTVVDATRGARSGARAGTGRAVLRNLRRLGGVAVATVLVYAGMNVGASVASAYGLDALRPRRSSTSAYLAVRLGVADLSSPAVSRALAEDGITAVVDGQVARADPAGLAALARSGVGIANGGWSGDNDVHVLGMSNEVSGPADLLETATGFRPRLFVPSQGLNIVDLTSAELDHERIVRDVVNFPTRGRVPIRPGSVYVVNGIRLPPATLVAELQALVATFNERRIPTQPLNALA